jgi:DNA-binding IclR family transcriptional regulator
MLEVYPTSSLKGRPTMSTGAADRDPAPAVTRAIRILSLLAERQEPLSLSAIAKEIGAAKSSTSSICTVLVANDLVRKQSDGFALGPRLAELGGAYRSSFDEVRQFHQYCSESKALRRELVRLAMLDGTEVLYLARHEGHTPVRLAANVGDRLPAASTAVGNAMLALMSDDEVRARFTASTAFPLLTERSTSSIDELLQKLEATRGRGYAVDDGEVRTGIVGFAVAVPRTGRDQPLAIGVSLIEAAARDDGHTKELLAELHDIAEKLSRDVRSLQ